MSAITSSRADTIPSAPAAPPLVRGITRFARREFRDALASKWFLLYTLAFTVLAVGVSVLSLSGVGSHGFAGFGRTAAGLLNLIMLVVPLMALTAGAGSIAGERERGTLLYLLAQPVSRTQVLLGKYLGLAAALVCSLCVGFGVSAGVLAAIHDFVPRLPWYVYKYTQAQVHLFVMRGFARHLAQEIDAVAPA